MKGRQSRWLDGKQGGRRLPIRIDYRLWTDTQKPFSGKMILRPETTEEEQALRLFREHVGSPQRGRKFEIIFKRKGLSPAELHEALRKVETGAAG